MRRIRRWSLLLALLLPAGLAADSRPGGSALMAAPAPAAPARAAEPVEIQSLSALVAATRTPVPAEVGFRLYTLRCPYAIYVIHFADEAAMMQHLARVMCWFDIPDGRRYATGSIADARRAVARALGPKNMVGAAQYTLQQVAETFTAACPATGSPPWAAEEERLLARLAAASLLRRDGPKCEAPTPGSLVVVFGREGAESLHHELNHALYAQSADYREAIDRAWESQLTPEERDEFARTLGGMGYNTGNQRLMRSEFSAYACAGPLTPKCRPEVLEWVRTREREFFPALQEDASAGKGELPSELPPQRAEPGPAAAPD